MGAVATQLIAQTRCPVVVLHPGTAIPAVDAPVVAGVQYGSPCAPVLRAAFEQADSRHVNRVVVHAWQLDASTTVDGIELRGVPAREAQEREVALLQRNIADIARSHPHVTVTVASVRAGISQALNRYCADAALLVIGSRGRGEISGAFLGSVSQRMIRAAACAVMVVRDGRSTLVSSDAGTATAMSS